MAAQINVTVLSGSKYDLSKDEAANLQTDTNAAMQALIVAGQTIDDMEVIYIDRAHYVIFFRSH